MHDAFFGIHSDVRLHPEVPLVSFLRLMHLRIALLLLILGRGRRVDNGRIDDRARGDANTPALQIQGSPYPASGRTVRALPAMAEVQDRGLVRRRGAAQINAGKATQ